MATRTRRPRLAPLDQQLLDALDHRALTVHEAAARVGATPQEARRRLAALRERGLLALDISNLRYSRAS